MEQADRSSAGPPTDQGARSRSASSRRRFRADRLRSIRDHGACTELTLVGGDRCLVPARPDVPAARRVLRGTRHVSSVRIDLGAGVRRPTASVLGSARHLPHRRPVTLGVALALAVAGLPTSVRHPAGRRSAVAP